MNNTEDPTNFERRSKAVFDDSTEALNGDVRSRLTQARHRAVAKAGLSRAQSTRRFLLPAAGLGAAALATALVVMPPRSSDRGLPESLAAADDMTILLNGDADLEMLENMEFYAWMDSDAAAEPDNVADSDTQS